MNSKKEQLKPMDFWKRVAALILLVNFLICSISGLLRVVEINSIFDRFLPTLSGWVLLVMAIVLWSGFKKAAKHGW